MPWHPRHWVAVTAVLCGACGADGPDGSVSVAPAARAVAIETSACGDASRTAGSGVVVGDGRVLTAGHVAVGASRLTVTHAGVGHAASIVHLDVTRDLAVLAVPGVELPGVELAGASAGDDVTIVEGRSSGTIVAVVRRRVVMDVDDVRGTDRHERDGYELDAAISGGDSGAGVFDDAGRLLAIVFAEPTARDAITYAVGGPELSVVLGAPERKYQCRAELSRVVEVEAEAETSATIAGSTVPA